ncbi:mechanosensitive ion channel family protein [Capnocytophaga sp. oral taxon 338]|jgi:Small-conductance mechanosensitive channel|uniref:mechanosensitive ion channel family protein n=1 Tax=Capnocytophaga sp. oral taxon 338 TaxID=710239 RepID=UPI000202C619|nr:mechanosensitive ion channel domain-containing protein [Capnocytophaga sp. oral taxon 338]EGD33927.1 MscS family small conductance mechanosenstive ion channel [Capnocytophaga sp. oral taxon 338 str. F0234]
MKQSPASFNDFEAFLNKFIDKTISFLPNLIGAIILFVVGIWVCRIIRKFVKRIMISRSVDTTIQNFVNELLRWILYIILFLTVIQKIGVPVSSFLGALAAAGVAVGLALQGSLSNFAGGIMLLILKPFRIGDSIETKGHIGNVERIGMFYTTIIKFGNEQVMIPNGPLFSDNIVNYSRTKKRRDKIIVGIGYGSDLKKAKEILYTLAKECPTALQDPIPIVYVEELADSSVNLSLRVWSNTENYWDTHFYLVEQMKLSFDKENIEIPFPQTDVHIIPN